MLSFRQTEEFFRILGIWEFGLEVIPAVDIKDGKCVRLFQGKFDSAVVYSDDPLEAARRWREEGAGRLHVVDLDGARTGSPVNLNVVRRIASECGIPVQFGGGVRSLDALVSVLEAGIDRVVLGTSAALNEDFAREVFYRFGERVILGVDAKDGKVAVRGWECILDIDAVDFAKKMQRMGAKRVIFTDIGRDGALQGINLARLKEMVAALEIPVIASGGVASTTDILAAKDAGAEGVIIGKALYEGSLTLREAMEAAGCWPKG
jgi:phosphoribosylformimino-5-aminoimidazole carboxamide ribotide isomerase